MTESLQARWATGAALIFYLSAAAPCSARTETPTLARDNIVLVLDASGSMRKPMSGQTASRMEIAQQALSEVLRTLPASAHLGLLVFSGADADGKPIKDHWVYPLGPINAELLNAAIRRPRPDGNTPLGKYLKIGADELLRLRASQRGVGTFRLLVVSDGEANDKPLVDRYLPDLMTRGIIVDVIGVDMESAHALATQVHSYRRANDPIALRQAVAASLAELGATRDAAADAEAYAAVAALPDALVTDVLKSFSALRDYPIGDPPPAADLVLPPGPEPRPAADSTAKQPADATSTGDVAVSESSSLWFWLLIGFGVLVILKRGRRRKAR